MSSKSICEKYNSRCSRFKQSPRRGTNYICLDRDNVLQSTFTELESITDYRVTFEVDFLGEMAKDYGGPRKEWITLVNKAIKKKILTTASATY